MAKEKTWWIEWSLQYRLKVDKADHDKVIKILEAIKDGKYDISNAQEQFGGFNFYPEGKLD